MSAPPKIDWPAIRTAYLAEYAAVGSVDAKELAQKFNVHYGTLRNKISQEKWAADAAQVHAAVEEATKTQIATTIATHRVEVLDKHLNFLGNLRHAALAHLATLVQEKKLTADLAMKIVFNSLRAEKALHEIVAPTQSNTPPNDLEERAAKFDAFLDKIMAAEGAPKEPVLLKPKTDAA